MTSRIRTAPVPVSAALVAAAVCAPAAQAAPAPQWNGWYRVSFHTDQKSGTSLAAGQAEEPYSVLFRFATDCSTGSCLASVVDGPAPKNNVPQAATFAWTGSQWSRTNTWRWDCLLPDGTITFDPASSVTTYSPRPDGSLIGVFATNIADGACQGSVSIPMTAVPGNPTTA